MTDEEWLKEYFEDSFCDFCGGDVQHHHVIHLQFLGGVPFAACDYPPDEETGGLHPVIAEFRELWDMEHDDEWRDWRE